jgi:two-component system repressor protein LuxO
MKQDRAQRIVILDDTKTLAEMFAKSLSILGYDTLVLHSANDLLDYLAMQGEPDLLVLDVRLPDIDGLDLLSDLKSRHFNAPVIVVTGHGSINMAVEAMRHGAADFLVKPFPIEKLGQSVERMIGAAGLLTKAKAVEGEHALPDEIDMPRPAPQMRAGFGGFIGISPLMQIVYDIIENAAKSTATVFITGESGTGKEICAEAIHRYSKRAKAPFIAINCAAIPRELLESELFGHVKGAFTGAVSDRDGAVAQAHGGTLFLDEIAEMAPDMQTKLLRFLQNLTYQKVGGNKVAKANVRIICATNREPMEEIKEGRLRQDLYYRLHVIPIAMPPLRFRKTDIIDLADYFLKLYAREEGKQFREFTPEAERKLLSYSWPGNVRQLQNIVRGIVVMHDRKTVLPDMLPLELDEKYANMKTPAAISPQSKQSPSTDGEITPLWQIEKHAIEYAIERCDGNIPKAAAMLEISPSTIYRKKMSWDRGMPPTSGAYL